ncbi:MAG: hypothetical protein AB7O96_04035 [Pseudobdellovibrionaceae bacterium]
MREHKILSNYNQTELNVFAIWQDSTNQDLIRTLCRFSELVRHYGYNVEPYSINALERLEQMPKEKVQEITASFKTWCAFIEPTMEDGVSRDPATLEEMFLRKALAHYDLHVSEEFWKTLERDTLIEIYGQNMVQIYRSLNFFSVCAYSLLDLSVYEWFVLYQRPTQISQELLYCAQEALVDFVSVKTIEVPKHIIREHHHSGNTVPFRPKAIHVEMNYISSLFTAFAEDRPSAFICTSKARVIAEGEDAEKIQFV